MGTGGEGTGYLEKGRVIGGFYDLSSPRGAWAFDELRMYHTRPLRFNWDPENVHFGKTHLRDLIINARLFFLEI